MSKDDQNDLPVPQGEALVLSDAWDYVETRALDARHLARNRIISAAQSDPAHRAFDMLRTRLLQTIEERGWGRIAVTSPTRGCGKTFVAANLAHAIARRETYRTVLLDMDLRQPGLAKALGIADDKSMKDFLQGYEEPEKFLIRVGGNLAVGVSHAPGDSASEVLQESMTVEVLDELMDTVRPSVVLYDMGPALESDDVVAFLPNVDGVLLVAGGGVTTPDQVRQCERLISPKAPILGVILNRAEDGLTL